MAMLSGPLRGSTVANLLDAIPRPASWVPRIFCDRGAVTAILHEIEHRTTRRRSSTFLSLSHGIGRCAHSNGAVAMLQAIALHQEHTIGRPPSMHRERVRDSSFSAFSTKHR